MSMNGQKTANKQKSGDFLDRLLSGPLFYTLFAFIAVRANDLKKVERAVYGLGDFDPWQGFPFLRFALWLLCGAVLGMYAYRWIGKKISRKQPMLLCFLAMHAALIVMTLIYRGASGYWLHWTCALCLMLALDMGLQREKNSVLEGFSLALLLFELVKLGFKHSERSFFVLELGFLVLARDDDASRHMGQAHRRVGRVNALTARTTCMTNTNFNIFRSNGNVNFLSFWKHGYSSRRGMNSAIGLGYRYTLNSMASTFVFQNFIYIFTANHQDNFFKSSRFRRVTGH